MPLISRAMARAPETSDSSARRRRAALAATAALAAAIFWLTLTPPQPGPVGPLSDKAYHALAFAALIFPSALLYRRALPWLLPTAALLGAAIELIQPAVGRSGDLADFLADLAGLAIGLGLGLGCRALLGKRL